MLTEAQKRQLAAEGAQEVRRGWGEVLPQSLAAAIDDLRARVIEEGWYERPLYELSTELKDLLRFEELYGQKSNEREQAPQQDMDRQLDDELGR